MVSQEVLKRPEQFGSMLHSTRTMACWGRRIVTFEKLVIQTGFAGN